MHIPNRNADRSEAIARAYAHFDDGDFVETLRRRVAIPSSSQEPEHAAAMHAYLRDEMAPALAPLGFTSRIFENPKSGAPPFLVAERIEDPDALTVLIYGHGDTVRGLDDLWRPGLAPWDLSVEGDRIYGRGTADNKGQHSINIAALAAVLAEARQARLQCQIPDRDGRGNRLPWPARTLRTAQRGALRADLLIASDGPRIAPDKPTLFLGARGGHPST